MKLLYISALSFVFISTSVLAISRISVGFDKQTPNVKKVLSLSNQRKFYPPLPVLKEEVFFPIISAQAALVVDLDSGVTLYEKNQDVPLLPASTTKIITALVAMDYYPKDLILKVGNISVDGQKMGLVKGEEIKVEDILYGLLIFSANDAAEVLAENFPGGRDLFINSMNLKAKELNLENSTFVNPTGLDGSGHLSTARDLIRISSYAMKDPFFSEIVGTKEKIVTSVNGKFVHRLRNLNELIGNVEGVLGVKTGWTEYARENLVTYVERNGKKVMIALLGSQDRFGETKELIDWIFENYEWREIVYPD